MYKERVYNESKILDRLTVRQEEVLNALCGTGGATEELAEILNVAPSTVLSHCNNLYQIFGLSGHKNATRPKLMAKAFQEGFVVDRSIL